MNVVIVGGGMSVKEGISKGLWDKIKECEIWSCNYAYKTMPYLPKRQFWVDPPFFKNNIEDLQKLQESGVECITRQHHLYEGLTDKLTLYGSTRVPEEYCGKDAINQNKIFYGRMGLVGMFALATAIGRGYSDIFLLGFDFGTPTIATKETHYYQNELRVYSTGVMHPEVYRRPNDTVNEEVSDFKKYADTEGVKIWNVSLMSNIQYFEKIEWERFFELCKIKYT